MLTALMVLRQRKHPESDFVLHRTDGSPWKKRAVQDQFSDLVKSAGLTVQTPVSMWRFIRFATRSEANSPLEVCLWERSRL